MAGGAMLSGLSAATFTTDLHAHAASAFRTPRSALRSGATTPHDPGKSRCPVEVGDVQWRGGMVSKKSEKDYGDAERHQKEFLITTQARRNLSSRSGIGGVLSAT